MVDAIAIRIAVLWVHGETHFASDVPRGCDQWRPAIALIVRPPSSGQPPSPSRVAAAGLFHVSLGLGELVAMRSASVMGYRPRHRVHGNESTTASSTVEDYESEAFAPRSHYTTKASGLHRGHRRDASGFPSRHRPEAASTARSPRSRKSA